MRLAAVAGTVAVLSAVIFAPDPDGNTRSSVTLHDFAHVPAFAVVGGCLLVLFTGRKEGARRHGLLSAAAVFTAAMALGTAAELIQSLFPGGAVDVRDLLADAAGVVAALLIAGSRASGIGTMRRILLRGAAATVAGMFLLPTAMALRDEASARRSFPVLADFASPAQLGRFKGSVCSRLSLGRNPASGSPSSSALHVRLEPGPYPGASLRYFPRDWRGFRALRLIAINASRDTFALHIRIDDLRHDETYRDRYNEVVQLAPGRRAIEIPLAVVESAPRGRKLDLRAVRVVVLFAMDLREPRDLWIEEIRLVR